MPNTRDDVLQHAKHRAHGALPNVVGGSVAGLLHVPESMAYAVIIVAPFVAFDPGFLSLGLASGVLALVLANLIPALFRGPGILICTPFSLASVMLGAVAVQIIDLTRTQPGGPPDLELAWVLLLAVVAMSGALQLLLGWLRLGQLAQYVPLPVIAGLRNGAALVIALSQLNPLLGIDPDAPLLALDLVSWATLAVGVLSVLTLWQGPRLCRSIPGPLWGVLAGCAGYYLLCELGLGEQLTGVVGPVPSALPQPQYADDLAALLGSPEGRALLLALVPSAVALALLNTLQTLISVAAADQLLATRSQPNRQLIALGLANVVSAAFGAMSAAGAVGGTLANYASGGRDRRSRIATGAFALAILLCLGTAIGYLPQVVLAGCLIGLSGLMIDRSSLGLVRSLFDGAGDRRRAALQDLAVIAAVMAILLAFGPLLAVAAGVVCAVVFFLFNLGADPVKRAYRAERIRSHTQRGELETEHLARVGGQIQVLELEGALFFGTSDRLAATLERLARAELRFIILDFNRVTAIDSTTANRLIQARRVCRHHGVTVLCCGLNSLTGGAHALCTSSDEALTDKTQHADLATALAYAEDRLLDQVLGAERYDRALPAEHVEVLAALAPKHRQTLATFLVPVSYRHGERIFAQGDAADGIYFLTRGRVTLWVQPPGAQGDRRLGQLCPGAVFGEMALFDHQPRSATVTAESTVHGFKLGLTQFQQLTTQHPAAGNALLVALSQTLVKRLRLANRYSTELLAGGPSVTRNLAIERPHYNPSTVPFEPCCREG